MLDGFENPHSVVRIVRRGEEVGYRAETWAPELTDRTLIGYFRTLRAAAKAARIHYAASLGHAGPPKASWGHEKPSSQMLSYEELRL